MNWLAVAIGGSLGAMSRYGLALMLPAVPGKFPVATFTVNVLGSFIMAIAFVLIIEKAALPGIWRQLVMVGFLGAFTTFSTYSIETLQLFTSGNWKLAVGYSFGSAVVCVAAAFAGYFLINKFI